MTELELEDALNTWIAPDPQTAAMRTALETRLGDRPITSRAGFRWAVAAAGLAVCAIVGASDFATAALGTFSASWDIPPGQLHVQIEHRIDPPVSPFHAMSYGGGGSAGQNARGLYGVGYVHDGSRTYYAYAYNLQLLGDGQLSLSFAMLAPSKLQPFLPFKMSGAVLNPPSLPPTQTIALGQPVEITLAETGGERIYDRIIFSSAAPPRPRQQSASTLRVEDPKIYIAGNLAAEDAGFRASGATLWIHVPGQGRYLIALDPQANPRFTLAGTAEGATVQFASGGVQYRIESSVPIASGGSQPVFVYHQLSFENLLDSTNSDAKRIFTGSAGPASMQQ